MKTMKAPINLKVDTAEFKRGLERCRKQLKQFAQATAFRVSLLELTIPPSCGSPPCGRPVARRYMAAVGPLCGACHLYAVSFAVFVL